MEADVVEVELGEREARLHVSGLQVTDYFTLANSFADGALLGEMAAKVSLDLLDSYRGALRMITLRMPIIDAQGRATLKEHQLEVNIPKGVRQGQHLRLQGQGAAGHGGGPAGDLYLEIAFAPQPVFRLDGADVYFLARGTLGGRTRRHGPGTDARRHCGTDRSSGLDTGPQAAPQRQGAARQAAG